MFIGPTKTYLSNAARLYLNERLILYCATLRAPLSRASPGCILLWCALDIYRIQRATTGPRNFNAMRRKEEEERGRVFSAARAGMDKRSVVTRSGRALFFFYSFFFIHDEARYSESRAKHLNIERPCHAYIRE